MTDPKAPLPDDVEKALNVVTAYANGNWHADTLSAHIAALEAENKRLLSVIGRIYGAASRYYDATQSYYSDTDCDADGWLADTASDLKLLLLKHKAALAQTDGGV